MRLERAAKAENILDLVLDQAEMLSDTRGRFVDEATRAVEVLKVAGRAGVRSVRLRHVPARLPLERQRRQHRPIRIQPFLPDCAFVGGRLFAWRLLSRSRLSIGGRSRLGLGSIEPDTQNEKFLGLICGVPTQDDRTDDRGIDARSPLARCQMCERNCPRAP